MKKEFLIYLSLSRNEMPNFMKKNTENTYRVFWKFYVNCPINYIHKHIHLVNIFRRNWMSQRKKRYYVIGSTRNRLICNWSIGRDIEQGNTWIDRSRKINPVELRNIYVWIYHLLIFYRSFKKKRNLTKTKPKRERVVSILVTKINIH